MTEEEKLRRSPGCGGAIAIGLIAIILLALVGIIFPGDILPYPNEILLVVIGVAVVALVITILMWRSKVRDRKKAEDDIADNLLRKGFETMGDKDDEASRLAQQYYNNDDSE